ncbi:MAG: hypothetical protein FJY83_05410 [Candidatus Aminicenantes bacterium]|nr:hypothetical protein [Candidatus Aminicenantes bacterium]
MKNSANLLELLKSLPHFSKMTVIQLGAQLLLKNSSVDTYISRYLRRRDIIQLKKGLYVASDYYSSNKGDVSYLYYLANILRTPSYVSSWAALQYYHLATESINVITSVTPKVTRVYMTKVGTFSYQSINKGLFADFSLMRGTPDSPAGKHDFHIATPPKALFDMLYFKTRQFRGVRPKDIEALIDELRIDIGEMNRKDRTAFHSMIRRYFNHE